MLVSEKPHRVLLKTYWGISMFCVQIYVKTAVEKAEINENFLNIVFPIFVHW